VLLEQPPDTYHFDLQKLFRAELDELEPFPTIARAPTQTQHRKVCPNCIRYYEGCRVRSAETQTNRAWLLAQSRWDAERLQGDCFKQDPRPPRDSARATSVTSY
jgi:hypothetical protein